LEDFNVRDASAKEFASLAQYRTCPLVMKDRAMLTVNAYADRLGQDPGPAD